MYSLAEGCLDNVTFLEKISSLVDYTNIVYKNKREYYNIPAAFDIEVSSFYDNGEKRAIMYIWQIGIYNYVTTGRTWKEFFIMIEAIKKVMQLSDDRRLVMYVHNLPYEFQFTRKRLDWEEVFLLEERKPVYANAHGVEFRCSLKLAGGKSLEKVGDDLQKYKVKKAVDSLDYEKIRTPITPLTEQELYYCEQDIRVLLSYIQEKIEQDGDITKIPLTNTGYVREYCRKNCFKKWRKYHDLMSELTVSPTEYSQLKRAFQGGFAHANAHYVNEVLNNVGSHDFGSSYPSVMLLEKFPMSKAITLQDNCPIDIYEHLMLTKCCMFDIEIFGIVPKLHQEHPISGSKCYVCEGVVFDNGRVVTADRIKTTITEQDYFTLILFYDWDYCTITNFRYYDKAYLPKDFAMSVLGLYQRKTTLKGIEGEEINYMISKNMANAAYGMIVTDPVRKETKYDGNDYYNPNTQSLEMFIAEKIEKYNDNVKRFLYYPWGVWVTAYARANLFSGIVSFGDDYVFSDTDSIKSLNTNKHVDYIRRYNDGIISKIEKSASHYRISPDEYSPSTLSGEKKTIGVWEFEGEYEKFKTLGAKRYMTYRNGKYVLTLAGANKFKSMKYLESTGKPFENFKHDLVIPKENTGRLILTYIDYETSGTVVDYLGQPYHYNEKSCVHMEPSEYHLSQSESFINYLKGMKDFGE